MVAALTILVLMTGTMFAIVSGSTQAVAEIGQVQEEDRRIETFIRLLRQTMANLPPGATLELRVVGTSPLVQELVLRGAPDAFALGPPEWSEAAECRLALQVAPDEVAAEWRRRRPAAEADAPSATASQPLHSLALSRPDFYVPQAGNSEAPVRSPMRRAEGTPWSRPDREGAFWLPLLPDLEELTWQFWDSRNKRWLDRADPTLPPMIELTLRPRGRLTPVRALFRPGT
ncbi:hypothetical protein BH23VER1_BH23VER1_06720 [soil metagenome]